MLKGNYLTTIRLCRPPRTSPTCSYSNQRYRRYLSVTIASLLFVSSIRTRAAYNRYLNSALPGISSAS